MSEQKRAGRNIKVKVTDDISHMGISDEEYYRLEKYYDHELSNTKVDKNNILTPVDEEFVAKESKLHGIDEKKLRQIISKYKKEHGEAI